MSQQEEQQQQQQQQQQSASNGNSWANTTESSRDERASGIGSPPPFLRLRANATLASSHPRRASRGEQLSDGLVHGSRDGYRNIRVFFACSLVFLAASGAFGPLAVFFFPSPTSPRPQTSSSSPSQPPTAQVCQATQAAKQVGRDRHARADMNRPAGRAAVQSPRWCKVVSDGGGDLMSATFLPGGRFAIAVDAG
ncbi:hypothetical protein CSPX01_10357 [Colletotrichum filicis]|nr:hypothetical protein CSPX01_10357 [Colletotrichum filicis]